MVEYRNKAVWKDGAFSYTNKECSVSDIPYELLDSLALHCTTKDTIQANL